MSETFAWAPHTVRHLFRRARFGVCSHGPSLRCVGPIVWAGAHGESECGTREVKIAAWFAVGHRREVPGRPRGNDGATFVAMLAAAEPITEDLVRAAIPAAQFDLASSLGVQTWGRVSPDGKRYGAVGFVLGLPTCAISPYADRAHVLGETRCAA